MPALLLGRLRSLVVGCGYKGHLDHLGIVDLTTYLHLELSARLSQLLGNIAAGDKHTSNMPYVYMMARADASAAKIQQGWVGEGKSQYRGAPALAVCQGH